MEWITPERIIWLLTPAPLLNQTTKVYRIFEVQIFMPRRQAVTADFFQAS